ncbi:aminoglycoside phosphotransferase (APT) family kinase protein [Pseudoglutamicibacter albus]|uniref:Aminoglycoside phosphotransferase (APT) family kinase protein n=2 Tax=Pseudoglutamicibacter albus TaxID=98671 RepID=A0ABU1Z019_9MICC|nr:phosphotransferase [Pseudoglutamicibacter albus]MDR7293923.1 aminoglycoside phosphotransferase (APT) family kinase protein [Pseudoglutamicibacter albus]
MKRSTLDLAAIATAAVPGLSAVQAGRLPEDSADFDSALIVDSQGKRWRVTSPRHADASMKLETEQSALDTLTAAARATLPFSVPTIAGTVVQGQLRTFVYHHLLGHVLDLQELEADGGRQLAQGVGQAIAAIHGLKHELVEASRLPVFEAEELRRGLLSQLDHVAESGKVPPELLRRWEEMMENVAWWRFNPTVIHGDLHEERLFIHEGRLQAVTGWSALRVGDPATDLAWVLGIDNPDTVDAIFEAYGQARGQLGDDDLRNRATLAAEFALASWLSGALTHADQAQIDQAEASLNQLNENILAVQRYEAELQRAAEEAERRRIEEEKRQAEERQRQEEERRRAEEQRRLEEEQLGAAEDLDTTAIPVVDASAGPSADERDTPPTRTGETTDATETTDTHEKP